MPDVPVEVAAKLALLTQLVPECPDDQEALGKAARTANGKAAELWQGARLIVRFPGDEG